MKNQFDVAIVGSGPAGMFAALEITRIRPTLRVLILEKGKIRSISEANTTRAALDAGERPNVTEGWGGAGAFSDGKFNLDYTGRVGGRLVSGGFVPESIYRERLRHAADMYIEFGGDAKRVFGIPCPEKAERVEQIRREAAGKRMELHTFEIMHLGTSKAHVIVENIREKLQLRGVEIRSECRVNDALLDNDRWHLQTTLEDIHCVKVVFCPGRSGADWFREFAIRQNIPLVNNGVDIGVRVETRQAIMSELARLFWEPKLYFRAPNDDELRTFCGCSEARVAIEEYRDTGISCANGHSDPADPTGNYNFSVLQTQVFTHPFNNPLAYGTCVAQLHNMLSGGVIVQRLGDLRHGRRSTLERLRQGNVSPTLTQKEGAEPGDLGLAMPYRFLRGILAFLEAMDAIAPGINLTDTLLYGPEIKFNAVLAHANPMRGFEAKPGLHVAGDGAGYTRGLNGASVMGLIVGGWIGENFDH